jgi:hypothetical protein
MSSITSLPLMHRTNDPAPRNKKSPGAVLPPDLGHVVYVFERTARPSALTPCVMGSFSRSFRRARKRSGRRMRCACELLPGKIVLKTLHKLYEDLMTLEIGKIEPMRRLVCNLG